MLNGLCFSPFLQAQLNTENQFSKPLKEVLNEVQKRYGITIRYVDSMVANKKVTYAEWKFRADAETTLDNILKPLEIDREDAEERAGNIAKLLNSSV